MKTRKDKTRDFRNRGSQVKDDGWIWSGREIIRKCHEREAQREVDECRGMLNPVYQVTERDFLAPIAGILSATASVSGVILRREDGFDVIT